jgi:hypothetical protein
MIGPPGTGKSMLAQRLPGLLVRPYPPEALSFRRIAPGRGVRVVAPPDFGDINPRRPASGPSKWPRPARHSIDSPYNVSGSGQLMKHVIQVGR